MARNSIGKSSVENLSGSGKTALANYSSGDFTFPIVPRGVHVNVGGTAVVRFEDDTADQTIVLNAGSFYPYRLQIIRNSGTTAGMGIVGLL